MFKKCFGYDVKYCMSMYRRPMSYNFKCRLSIQYFRFLLKVKCEIIYFYLLILYLILFPLLFELVMGLTLGTPV